MVNDLLLIAAAVVAILLVRQLYRYAGPARIAAFKAARRSTSRMVGSARLVLGTRRRAVGLAVTDKTLLYERPGLRASIDLDTVLAIEYDTALATGVEVRDGRVLRLRRTGGTIELVLPREDVSNWYMVLPPHPERERTTVVPWTTRTAAPAGAPHEWLR